MVKRITMRFAAFFMAVVFMTALLPVLTIHAANIIDSGTCGANGDNVTWTLDDEGTLTISGTGEMIYAYYLHDKYSEDIKKAVIENGVTNIVNDAFGNYTNLTSITIPDSVTNIGDHAFSSCKSLTDITIPSSVTSIGDSVFCGCTNMTNIYVDPSNMSYTSVDGVLFSHDGTLLHSYPAKKSDSYTIPNSVTSIGDYAFTLCEGLTSITIPNSVTGIGDYAFSECYDLTDITIPDSVTSIGDYAFYACYGLTDITILGNVTRIGDRAFSSCRSLTSITIPDSVSSIGSDAFERCESLTNITIPSSVTNIGNNAFSGCKSLISITIPDSVTRIEKNTFEGCESLTDTTILGGVTSIGDRAFSSCKNLISITISDSVTSIGDYAFRGCDSLTDVYYAGTEEQWKSIYVGSYNDPLENAVIHYNSTEIPAPVPLPAEASAVIEENGDITVTFTSTGNEVLEDTSFTAAYFDENGKFIGTFVKTVTIDENGAAVTVENSSIPENADNVRIMLWKDFDTLAPMSETITKEI